jgi:hypothetical protein
MEPGEVLLPVDKTTSVPEPTIAGRAAITPRIHLSFLQSSLPVGDPAYIAGRHTQRTVSPAPVVIGAVFLVLLIMHWRLAGNPAAADEDHGTHKRAADERTAVSFGWKDDLSL